MVADIIVVALVLAYCVFVLVRRFKASKQTKENPCAGCCGSCSGCSACCSAAPHAKPEKRTNNG